jgi:hypothetical protein
MVTDFDLTKEEFLALRSEATEQVAETRRLEVAAVGGAAAIYAWLATQQPTYGIKEVAWLLPILLSLFGGLRSYAIHRRITDISVYLKRIENKVPDTQKLLSGWEHFRESRVRYLAKSALAFWIILLLVCIALSIYGFRNQTQNAALRPAAKGAQMALSTDNWMTLAAAATAGTLVAIGWFITGYLNRAKDVAQKRLEYRLQALESFLPVWFAIQKSGGAPFAQPGFLQQLETARSKFQLHGYKDEIEIMERFVAAVQSSNLTDANNALSRLVPLVRVRIRKELRISD